MSFYDLVSLSYDLRTTIDVKLSINIFEGYDSFWNDLFPSFGKKEESFLSTDSVEYGETTAGSD